MPICIVRRGSMASWPSKTAETMARSSQLVLFQTLRSGVRIVKPPAKQKVKKNSNRLRFKWKRKLEKYLKTFTKNHSRVWSTRVRQHIRARHLKSEKNTVFFSLLDWSLSPLLSGVDSIDRMRVYYCVFRCGIWNTVKCFGAKARRKNTDRSQSDSIAFGLGKLNDTEESSSTIQACINIKTHTK